MGALWISHVHVTDPAQYGEYAKRATGAIGAYGGVFLARGGEFSQMEGPERARNVVVRFESLEKAKACYASEAYQEALRFAKSSSVRELVIVEELD
ncbi:MAG: DUF1330 domain-containing protein [Pseudomonadota bacterium]